MVAMRSSNVICKDNLKPGEFELFPIQLNFYLQLELIKHVDISVYMKLLQLYNREEGYAFPTIARLMVDLKIGGKATIDNSLDRLEKSGLIEKAKGYRGNNIYYVYKPLDKYELNKLLPEKVVKYKEFEEKILKNANLDKVRYQQHLQDQQVN
ncbi:transcriptional regulator [Lysinibacillus yapensis]|uniref:Transcriptional regulator n=1 Tax=Ureibacillus yapensis TaxID=2304605 RepID=A0A396S7J1_9BACL|nr:helix-turn-helix domain-containing protein [Lysinibacillus yapensis]RHW36669.1 transcriptional regulator [Lysinibacillus yapensis]